MAVDFGGQDIIAVAGADMYGQRFHGVKMQADGTIVPAIIGDERCIGVLQNAPVEAGTGRVRINGVSKVCVGGRVRYNDELMVNTAARFVPASSGNYVHAIALEPANDDGDIIRALVVMYQKV